jgi:putative phosphoribosyl transferase
MGAERFDNRHEAGRLLGEHLLHWRLPNPVVLGLARGGVVVASEVASVLRCALDVVVVRKLGHPHQPELGLGAIAEEGEPTFDDRALRRYGLTIEDLTPVVDAERLELTRRIETYRGQRRLASLEACSAVLVDDGLATGVTARAAVQAVRAQRPARVIFAAPVASDHAVEHLRERVDDIVVLRTPRHFVAVGQWYVEFDQVPDEQVLSLLSRT